MKKLPKSTSEKITILNFICAILVITIHTYNIDMYSIKCTTYMNRFIYVFENIISQNIARIAVPFFFLFSSFFFFYNVKNTEQWYTKKIKKRLHTIAIPYVFWNFIAYLFFLMPLFVPILRRFVGGDIEELSLVDFFNAIFLYKYNYGFWFLYNLILFFICSPAIYILLKNRYIGFITTFVCMGVWLFDVNIPIKYGPTSIALFFCLLGGYYAIHYDKINQIKLSKKQTFFTVFIWFIMIFSSIRFENKVISNLCIMFGIVSVWFLFDIIDCTRIIKCKYLKCSFMIYVLHGYILEALEKVVYMSLGTKPIFALIDYIVAPCVTTVIVIIIINIIKKISPKMYKLISGDR